MCGLGRADMGGTCIPELGSVQSGGEGLRAAPGEELCEWDGCKPPGV